MQQRCAPVLRAQQRHAHKHRTQPLAVADIKAAVVADMKAAVVAVDIMAAVVVADMKTADGAKL
jgi:hypothetical protein